MKKRNDRHYLHEFMTGQRPQPRITGFVRFRNFLLWVLIISLLAELAYLLIHG